MQSFKDARRSFWRSKWTTFVNVVGLTLGLACFITAQSALTYLNASDRQFEKNGEIYLITERSHSREAGGFDTGVSVLSSPPLAEHLRVDFPKLDATYVRGAGELELSAGSGRFLLRGVIADSKYLRMFAFPALSGETQSALDKPNHIVISAEAARKLFAGTDVVGRTVLLSTKLNLTVSAILAPIPQPSHIGTTPLHLYSFDFIITPQAFDHLQRTRLGDTYKPRPLTEQWGNQSGFTYIRFNKAGGITAATLRTYLKTFADRHVPRNYSLTMRHEFGIVSVAESRLLAVAEATVGVGGLRVDWALSGVALLILVVACFNYGI